ncbi:MAG: diguanylate cyclase [Thermoanaerobaculia bacterium]
MNKYPEPDPPEQDHPTVLIVITGDHAGHDGLLLQILLSEVARDAGRSQLPGLTTVTAPSEAAALELLKRDLPEIVLLQSTFDDGGLATLQKLQDAAPEVPVVAIANCHDPEVIGRVVDVGAHDCLLKPELSSATLGRALRYAMERQFNATTLHRLQRYDPLTGLLSGQTLLEMLGRMLERRQKQPDLSFGVLVVEVGDIYVTVRRHGRAFADHLLVGIARRLEQAARAGDLVARLDAEDFALVLQSIQSLADIRSVAERVRTLLSEPMPIEQQVNLSIRSGLALSGQAWDGAHDMLGAAVLRLKCS